MYTYKCTRTNRERLAHEMQIKQYKNTYIRIRRQVFAWYGIAWHSTQHGIAHSMA